MQDSQQFFPSSPFYFHNIHKNPLLPQHKITKFNKKQVDKLVEYDYNQH